MADNVNMPGVAAPKEDNIKSFVSYFEVCTQPCCGSFLAFVLRVIFVILSCLFLAAL